ncbi:bifunctional DNA-formamidopyrimidine glycosylase/DNA-(apurinic or apyrimidinic site) lyase [Hellea sp.]|nr:bifunctional DNA-formamidopyrimidine glycosylase/DNA-(apurinic or apyrimidinic site) lyase [Hellea sp.]MDA8996894.1 bifunctional DNA-formamidopyrimidine glycosylase/DNA-(apurinic or apyrimidinic site) lyase [Hellea sp.]MDB4845379.1 bifunctional DNA-formamidopyrimidine glycosylase/DNA-(apurinic or apyrimidinic site) lyase [Hellea sp.]MDC1061323.1 bifunctional DNA-formamidopyrimidine glycosylase/DNA-(apurinic or apyrimidinic site) lyase [Hellea sp.]MDC1088307.1 bifunctional DNA-formamidopyrimi
MPELPEVETVKRGLEPVMQGFKFERVTLNRLNLRFPFDKNFISRIQGKILTSLIRRGKFLKATLSSNDVLYMHLGMSGRFSIDNDLTALYNSNNSTNPKHNHVIFEMSNGVVVTYNDPRRFGFMELIAPGEPSRLDKMGPEPLDNMFNAPYLFNKLSGKKSAIKSALLDQSIIGGLGNIYVCEAIFKAKISPKRLAGSLTIKETEILVNEIKGVIKKAIEAGGSSLKDFASVNGNLGYFQHSFEVYGQEKKPCVVCETPIERIIQSGRSSFYCKACQK